MNSALKRKVFFDTMLLTGMFLLAGFGVANGQEKMEKESPLRSAPTFSLVRDSVFVIHFPVNKFTIQEKFAGNAKTLARLDQFLTQIEQSGYFEEKAVRITSSASPEGNKRTNSILAKRRGEALKKWILERHPSFGSSVSLESWQVAFDGLLAKQDKNAFPSMRFATAQLEWPEGLAKAVAVKAGAEKPVYLETPDHLLSYNPYVMQLPQEPTLQDTLIRVPVLAVSTNALYDLAITPNFALEVPIGKNWSVWGEYTFPWWVNKANDRAWQILKWDLGTRYWFSKKDKNDPMDVLRGHFVGIDLTTGYYDIEPKHKGYQGEFQSAGLEYGYSWLLGKKKHWRLQASLVVGWMGTHYRYYEGNERDTRLMYKYSGRFTWFGPTRANITFQYIITKKKKVQ